MIRWPGMTHVVVVRELERDTTFWQDMSVEWRRRSVCAILLEVRA